MTTLCLVIDLGPADLRLPDPRLAESLHLSSLRTLNGLNARSLVAHTPRLVCAHLTLHAIADPAAENLAIFAISAFDSQCLAEIVHRHA